MAVMWPNKPVRFKCVQVCCKHKQAAHYPIQPFKSFLGIVICTMSTHINLPVSADAVWLHMNESIEFYISTLNLKWQTTI